MRKKDTILLLERLDFSSKRALFNDSSSIYYPEWVSGRFLTGNCYLQMNIVPSDWLLTKKDDQIWMLTLPPLNMIQYGVLLKKPAEFRVLSVNKNTYNAKKNAIV